LRPRFRSINFLDRPFAALVHSACNKPGSRQVTHRSVRSGHGSVDRGSVSDSQADSAGSIPVTRSTRHKRAVHRNRAPSHLWRGARRHQNQHSCHYRVPLTILAKCRGTSASSFGLVFFGGAHQLRSSSPLSIA